MPRILSMSFATSNSGSPQLMYAAEQGWHPPYGSSLSGYVVIGVDEGQASSLVDVIVSVVSVAWQPIVGKQVVDVQSVVGIAPAAAVVTVQYSTQSVAVRVVSQVEGPHFPSAQPELPQLPSRQPPPPQRSSGQFPGQSPNPQPPPQPYTPQPPSHARSPQPPPQPKKRHSIAPQPLQPGVLVGRAIEP
ncbi:hypothetical protein BJX63DRAFT_429899 [Aspergillus granulosus]|uniref:Uncharacterized protein n=1 Tax=Aspergillus granulosus TaxID=176169 RepID=A0ABR4HP68_9EURO